MAEKKTFTTETIEKLRRDRKAREEAGEAEKTGKIYDVEFSEPDPAAKPTVAGKHAPAAKPEEDVVIGKKYIEVPVKSALPFWWAAGVWVLLSIFGAMYSIVYLIVSALLAGLTFFIASKLVKKETRRVEVPVSSGNVEVDDMINQINAVCEAIDKDRRAVLERRPVTASKMLNIQRTAGKIRDVVAGSPEDLPRIRKFLNYYLPTTVKLCDKYAFIVGNGGSGTNIDETTSSIESALAQLDISYKNLYDSLFDDDALDITTDVTVLESMIKRDNLE